MKNTLLAATLMLLACIPAGAQRRPAQPGSKAVQSRQYNPSDGRLPKDTIPGIGIFKIDAATIDSIRLQTGSSLLPDAAGVRQPGILYDQQPDAAAHIAVPALDRYRLFGLSGYTFHDVELHSIRMIFFRDTLIYFSSSDAPLLQEMLEFRYGNGSYSFQKDSITCPAAGNSSKPALATYSESYIWGNGRASAVRYRSGRYDAGCEFKTSSGFLMFDEKKFAQYTALTAAPAKQ